MSRRQLYTIRLALATHIGDAENFATLGKLNPTSPSRLKQNQDNITVSFQSFLFFPGAALSCLDCSLVTSKAPPKLDLPRASISLPIFSMVAFVASGCSKDSSMLARIDRAEYHRFNTMSSLLWLAAPMTRPTQRSTPAMSCQHSDILELSRIAFRSFRR